MSRRDDMLRLVYPPPAGRKRKPTVKKITRVIILAAFLGLLIYCGHALFQVRHVVVKGACLLDPTEVVAASGIREGTSIWLFRKSIAAGRLELLPQVSAAAVNRRLPATVVIEIREREPAAYLLCEGRFCMVDSEGVVFDTVPSLESSLPVITGVPGDEIAAGLPLGCPDRAGALETFLAALGRVPELDVAELNLENPYDMLVYTVDGKKILLGCSEKMDRKLKLIYESLPHLAGAAANVRLDVRTGDQLVVVTGPNTSPGEVPP